MLKLNICSDVKKYLYLNKVLMKVFTTFAINFENDGQEKQQTGIFTKNKRFFHQ